MGTLLLARSVRKARTANLSKGCFQVKAGKKLGISALPHLQGIQFWPMPRELLAQQLNLRWVVALAKAW